MKPYIKLIFYLFEVIVRHESRIKALEGMLIKFDYIDVRLALVGAISSSFSNEELDSLAFDVGLDDGLVGRTKGERVRSLISQCEMRRTTRILIDICKRERPNTKWPDFPPQTPPPH